ncbi:MAG: TonB-dependent receptor [Phenylobacterium sp.]|jgi:outer membrane receptor protein involved in Fe transport|nr:TonB-dependent receptor [Phenylobacterium sp.]
MKRALYSGMASTLALVAATSVSAQAAEQGHSTPSVRAPNEVSLEEVIVTAERRSSRIQDTPLALTVVDGEKLRQGGNQGLTELAQRIPSLSFAQSFGISQIFIRGVGNNFFSPGGDPGVATYADGVYLSDQEATAVAFLDLDRIEVLRGPQGALYGRNATGGAVNLISARPSEVFEGRAGAQIGDFGRKQVDALVSGPIGGGVTARASVQYRTLSGFTRNELAGTPGAKRRGDAEDSLAGRLQLTAPLGEGRLRLIANGYTQDDTGPALKILADPFPQPAELLFGVTPSRDPRSFKSEGAENRRDVWSVTGQVDYPIGDTELVVIADTRGSDRAITYDQDGTERRVSTTTLDTESTQTSFEAYLKGSTGRIDWLAGATWLKFSQSRTTLVDGVLPGAFLNPSLPVTFPFPYAFAGGGEVTTEAVAAYADGKLEISDTFALRLGGRYSDDRKRASEFLTFLAPTLRGNQRDSWGEWSGKAGIDFTPSDGTLLYASLARGFKSGALNVGAFTPAVAPEINVTVEAGARLSGSGWILNLTGYTSDYSDLQIVQVGPLSQILANAASARINGVEFDSGLKVSPRLTLNVSGSWMDAEFGAFVSTDQRRGFKAFDVSGNRLPLTSRWQGSLVAQYQAPLRDGGRLDLDAALQWRSEYFFTEFNTPDARQGGFVRFDLGAAWTSPDERWVVNVFGRNLSDRRVLSSLAVVSPLLGSVRVASLEPPRHVGIGVERRF